MATSEDDIYKEQLPNVPALLKSQTRKLCRPATLTSKLPIFKWLPSYRIEYLFSDFIAGFTVGLTTIPQAIAYGVVAGLEPQYGLYSAFMGCFAYIFFGSTKDVTIATTAIMALMVHQYAIISPEYAVLISFLAGCIILILGLLNLGVLVNFISMPVITGFTMAAATTIGSAQINNLFGISSPSNQFIASWENFFTHLDKTRLNDALLGVLSLAFILAMKYVKDIPFGNKSFWKYLSLSRNALAVIIGTLLAYLLSRDGSQPFRVTGTIRPGLPPFSAPPFSANVNGTIVPFSEMISTVGASLASIPLVAILEVVAIAKAFAKGKVVKASQEMIALGMCNIMGSFVLSMPVTGSFTRTAVNNASGVKTPLGGLVTGCLVLAALAFLTQTFYFIPKATLSAIIIAAMISLVELEKIAQMWKSKKLDLFPFMVTYFTCLFWSLEYGILCGIAANLSFILHGSARPRLELQISEIAGHAVIIVDVKQRLDFASAEYLKEKVLKFVNQHCGSDIRIVIVKGEQIHSIDYSVAMNFITLKDDLEALNCQLLCVNWKLSTMGVILRLKRELRSMFKNMHEVETTVTNYYKQIMTATSDSLNTDISVL